MAMKLSSGLTEEEAIICQGLKAFAEAYKRAVIESWRIINDAAFWFTYCRNPSKYWRLFNKENYQNVVWRGIEALGEGRL